ncbi:hypothetical protein FACS1894102_6990 [Spirochaetia bacterium]|nr:hypothetical protein FACS1894102_6990 [Spirochaetia bacterium]
MKRIGICVLLLFASALLLPAQDFYCDVGMGFGTASSKVDGKKVSDNFENSNFSDSVIDFGFKVGSGPLLDVPVYIIFEFAGVVHFLDDGDYFVTLSSYLIGPGFIYYPTRMLQLALSFGYSFIANATDLSAANFGSSRSGIAWDFSIALDLGKYYSSSCLVGVKYFGSSNVLKASNETQLTNMIGIFIRYTYRQKLFY